MSAQQNFLFEKLNSFFTEAQSGFHLINEQRKRLLHEIAEYILQKKLSNTKTNLTFICTHNSRRSHISQIMAQAAAAYYGVHNVYCYSGGTEVTAFNENAVHALQQIGFEIIARNKTSTTVYEVGFASNANKLKAFSKLYTDVSK